MKKHHEFDIELPDRLVAGLKPKRQEVKSNGDTKLPKRTKHHHEKKHNPR
jgi:hypothetical protein